MMISRKIKNRRIEKKSSEIEPTEQDIVLDSIPALIYFKDKKNNFLRVNKAFASFMGRKKEELEGKSVFDLYTKKQADISFEEDKEVMTSGKHKNIMIEAIDVKNKTRLIKTEKIPYRGKNGTILGVIGFSVDVTDSERMKEDMQNSELRFRRLFETSQDGILILNSETGQIDEVNRFLISMLGYTHKELLKKKLWEVGAFVDINKCKESFKETQKTGYVRYEDMPLQTKDGRFIHVEFVSNLYIEGNSKVIQCNIRDITDRMSLELAKEQNKFLEEEKKKLEFIAEISHEFRTPLAIIKGNIDLASIDAKKKKTKFDSKVLRRINDEVKYLSDLLSDMTLLITTSSQSQNMIIREVDIDKLINRCIKRWEAITLKKDISIHKKSTEVTILGDEKYLERLFINIIKNAIVYGKHGGRIQINVLKKKDEVEISFADNGIGMNKEDLESIFNRFYRADKSYISNKYSVGLGLAIVKWIAEAHGGRVSATSLGLGKGSTFTVFLPLPGGGRKGPKLA